ncbi:MAG: integrin alpha [Planctomycetota bacterium]
MTLRMSRRAAGLLTLLVLAGPTAAQPVFIETFNDDSLDESLWRTIQNGVGVNVIETGGRLEFSSVGNTGQAGIFARDWALATSGDIRLALEYNLTIPNTGQAAVGLNLTLFQDSDPTQGIIGDQLDIGLFRQGANYLLQWFLFDDGTFVDGDAFLATANTGTMYVFYDESADRVWLSSMGFGNQPDAIRIDDVITRTGAQHLTPYLGGFVNGTPTAVDGDDVWADRLRVTEGQLLDLAAPEVQFLDARDDADWFRRGDDSGDRLGWTVRFAGDLDGDERGEVAVGVPRDDDAASNAGSVSVFSGDDGSLVFQKLGENAGDQLGFAVDGAGDWNNDGVDDVIVGAPRFDTAEHGNAGKVYVFSGAAPHDLLWSRTGEATGDNFGYAVAGIGDVNNDGYDDVLVGAPFNDAGGANAGRAYVYLGGSGALWSRKRGQGPDDQFGRVVAPAGDVDDDGDPDYLVAAPFSSANGDRSGKVYVYAGDSNQRLHAFTGRSAGDRLGASADGVGDVNGDNYGDVIVGASHDDAAGKNGGAAFVFSGADGSVLLEIIGEGPGELFGSAVCGVRDLDGDGVPELFIDATRSNAGGGNAGRACIFSGVDGALLVVIDGEGNGNQFGGVVDADRQAGDVVSVLGGAWRFTSGGMNKRGSVYRFDFDAP